MSRLAHNRHASRTTSRIAHNADRDLPAVAGRLGSARTRFRYGRGERLWLVNPEVGTAQFSIVTLLRAAEGRFRRGLLDGAERLTVGAGEVKDVLGLVSGRNVRASAYMAGVRS